MLTEDIIKFYLVSPELLEKRKHPFYKDSVLITNKLEAHSKGKYPKDIIEMYRPNETDEQKQYRKDVFKAVTKTYFSKAVSTFGKIKKAEDWSVKFEYTSNKIAEEESLENYTCEDFPDFGSLQNWFWSFQFTEMFDDPNGVIAVFPFPKEDPTNDSEYLKPFPFWFESDAVIEYKESELAVLLSAEKSKVTNGDSMELSGLVYYIFDTDSFAKCTQTGEKGDYVFNVEINPLPFKYFPCFKIGGVLEQFKNGEKLYDSFMGDCLPFWDEALARWSDLQIQNVLHVHSDRWEIEDTPCKTCNGSGQVKTNYMGGGNGMIGCTSCGGTGSTSLRSPFGVKVIKPVRKVNVSESINIPTPPMGYINKPIEDSKFIKEQFYENIENGFAAINMEFVMFEPAENSGVAKTLDRQEINTTLGNVAFHVVNNIQNPIYFLCALWRYSNILPEDEILKLVPHITVPKKFDVLNEEILSNRLAAAKTSGASASYLSNIEIQLSKKEFGDDSIQAKMIEANAKLDPIPNMDAQSKMTVLTNKGTTQQNYILSCNLTGFLNRAYSENSDFFELSYDEQMSIMDEYVQEIIDGQNAAKVPQVIRVPAYGYEPVPNAKRASGSEDTALTKTKNGDALPTNINAI